MVVEAKDYTPLFNKEIVKRGKKSYCKTFLCLDTETSHNHDDENPIGWIYQWAFRENDNRVIGRTPTQFIQCLKKTQEYCEDLDGKIIIFVHNLSYDIEYLRDWLYKEFGDYSILALKPHEFITFKIACFEFRCTYRLSGKSLEKWGKDLDTEHKKLVGAIDYDLINFQDSDLQQIDWEYQIGDIDTLYDCIIKQMEIYGDTLATLPLTATGYVRREARKNFRKDPKNWKRFQNTRTDLQVYKMLDNEFAGAISHGNRFYAGKTIKGKIRHRDFRSHYPSQQRVRTYPVGGFNKWGSHLSLDDIEELKQDYCILMTVIVENVELRDRHVTIPPLSSDKCYKGKLTELNMIEDNGRVLKLEGTTKLILTEIDLEILVEYYSIEYYDIVEAYVSTRGKMLNYMIETVDEFMLGKTKFKKLYEESKDFDDYANLMKSKAGLNGIYGMSAQRPIKPELELDPDGEYKIVEVLTDEVMNEKLETYYKSRNSFMRFCLGCWCTSWARWELLQYCKTIGWENVLYCDTDSAFYLSTPEIEERIENLNSENKKRAMELGAYIEYEGNIVTYDEFVDEKEDITEFRFLHSKCYGYICEEKLHLVIAGVTAYEDATRKFSREEELGSLENLQEGFVFTRCGGTKAHYENCKPFLYEYEGHVLECASSCIITKNHKELHSMNNIYDSLIDWSVS